MKRHTQSLEELEAAYRKRLAKGALPDPDTVHLLQEYLSALEDAAESLIENYTPEAGIPASRGARLFLYHLEDSSLAVVDDQGRPRMVGRPIAPEEDPEELGRELLRLAWINDRLTRVWCLVEEET